MKKLYLVDVSSLFFRAFYAIRPLTSPQGVPVNAVYGYLSMLVKLIKEEKPDYMVICYDRPEPSFRKEIDVNYKANRTEMPEDLAVQIPYIKKLADLLGIKDIEKPSYEADDLIGSLALFGVSKSCEVVIVSGDKDFAQLVRPGISLLDTMKDARIDSEGVLKKWEVRPEQMIDYLSIVGDSSDNIPGVDGIGPKGAVKLLAQYQSLDGIYAHLDEISSASVKEKLTKSREQAYRAKELVKIVTDLDLGHPLEDYKLRPFKKEELKALLQELNFKSFEKSLALDGNGSASFSSQTVADKKVDLSNLETQTCSVEEFVSSLQPGQELWSFLDSQQQPVFSDKKKLFLVHGDLATLGKPIDAKMIQWKGFDLKATWRIIQVQTPMLSFDVMLAAYVLKSGDCSDLQKVLKDHGYELTGALEQPAEVFSFLFEMEKVLQKQLQEKNLWSVYLDLDLPLAAVLLRMENRGVKIDFTYLKNFLSELEIDLAKFESEIHQLAGEKFNVGSPKQLSNILFEKLKLPALKKTKTGYSTDNDVLEQLEHPIAKAMIEYRELAKLKSTYVETLPEIAHPLTHRIHTHFNQAATTTGRLSSTDPNLQNIPIRTERGQRVRKAFIAEGSNQLLSVDYSQIELRILAHICEDPGLIKAFQEDLDIHAATASEVFSKPLSEVTAEDRRIAKAVNFGIAYGQGAFGLAETLGISRTESQNIIKRYFTRFQRVQEYIESIVKTAYEKGYVETLFGRRRTIDELQSKNPALKKFGERAAINAPIQGTASDLMRKAMIEIDREVPVPLLLQVHDELIFEDSAANLEKYLPQICKIMENVMTLKVPLKVNANKGSNWDDAH